MGKSNEVKFSSTL